MAKAKPKAPGTTRARAGSKSSVAASSPKTKKAASKPAPRAKAAEPSGKKQASRRSQATPMLPKVRLTAEVTAGG